MTLADLFAIHIADRSQFPSEYIEALDLKYLGSKIGTEIIAEVQRSLPECIIWSYNDKFILPPDIDISGFASGSVECLPLAHMCELANVKPIDLLKARDSQHTLLNVLNRISKRTTSHINKIWKDYKDVKVELLPNGNKISINVKDKENRFPFALRSDGYKRFVAFLLMISARDRTEKLKGAVIIIDEPDIGLHPSGTRHLRDELIRIGEDNFVLFSSHSIFMIDRAKLERHWIVTKSREITTAARADESNFLDEEVLYNALGYSAFETLRERNLVFEGWRDKHVFHIAISNLPHRLQRGRATLQSLGSCHLVGVKDAARMAPILELANRQFLIVSDDDKVAIDIQQNFQRNFRWRGGGWKRYSEIGGPEDFITVEDYIEADAFVQGIASARVKYQIETDLVVANLEGPNKIERIRAWLRPSIANPEEVKEALDLIKGITFDDLQARHIRDEYWNVIDGILAWSRKK